MNMKWVKGKLQQIDIHSKAGKACVIRYEGKTIKLKTEKGKTYSLNAALALK